MFNKILLLSASAGAGHIRAAQALEKAIQEKHIAREVQHLDTLEFTNKVFRNLYSQTYLDMCNKAPELLGWLYDFMDKPWKRERRRLAFDKLNTRPLVKLLHKAKADLVVCTHFLPAEIISWLNGKEKLLQPQAIVVTDFDVHAMWLCHHYQHYFVPLDETRAHMEKLGIPAAKISVTGIPIDPVFAQEKDQREMRLKHGLEPDKTTILISAGGFGVGHIEHMIDSLLELKHPAQVVAICGKNEKLKESLESRHTPGTTRLHVVGFTKQMDEYMTAADVLVGKPGGLTTSEALAKGLILCIVNPIPGQEERNSDHLLEEGVAIRCNNLPALAYKLDKLLGDRQRLALMRNNVERLARPRAAYDIVDRLTALQDPA